MTTTATNRATGEGYIDVTATMGALKTWFDSHKVAHTGADLIAAASAEGLVACTD